MTIRQYDSQTGENRPGKNDSFVDSTDNVVLGSCVRGTAHCCDCALKGWLTLEYLALHPAAAIALLDKQMFEQIGIFALTHGEQRECERARGL